MHYFIDIADPLVAIDVRGMLAFHDPEARVDDLKGLEGLVPPAHVRDPALLVTTRKIARLRGDPSLAAFEEGGGRVLVLDGEEAATEKAATGWTFLARPVAEPELMGGITQALL